MLGQPKGGCLPVQDNGHAMVNGSDTVVGLGGQQGATESEGRVMIKDSREPEGLLFLTGHSDFLLTSPGGYLCFEIGGRRENAAFLAKQSAVERFSE